MWTVSTMAFGDLLLRERSGIGKTQEQLARAAGLTKGYVSLLERQPETRPSPDALRSLVTALQSFGSRITEYEAFREAGFPLPDVSEDAARAMALMEEIRSIGERWRPLAISSGGGGTTMPESELAKALRSFGGDFEYLDVFDPDQGRFALMRYVVRANEMPPFGAGTVLYFDEAYEPKRGAFVLLREGEGYTGRRLLPGETPGNVVGVLREVAMSPQAYLRLKGNGE